MSSRRGGGALAIVLHTHMPYVEGHGTWPFGEEWLWEAMACSYVPLLEVLESGAALTLSLTPVLGDQLEADGLHERFERFIREVRSVSHERDAAELRREGQEGLALELERASGDYDRALRAVGSRGGLLHPLAEHAAWTSSATHAVLPLLASDAGVALQVRSGVLAHRARSCAPWRGGFWLPECAYAPWLERPLLDAGVHAVCAELTGRLGLGAPGHLRPMRTASGLVVVPIDRATMALLWSDDGYPAGGAYRDYHHLTAHHHRPWGNDGAPYEHSRALALAREHARDFVQRAKARLAQAGAGEDALLVCAFDTELFGHWWYEGPHWLTGVAEECELQGLELVHLDDALERVEPVPAPQAGGLRSAQPITWGAGGDLSTWSGPQVAEMAFSARAAELRVVAAGRDADTVALRELLALQASDWPFMISRGLAEEYGHARFDGHMDSLTSALAAGRPAGGDLRNVAAHLDSSALLAP